MSIITAATIITTNKRLDTDTLQLIACGIEKGNRHGSGSGQVGRFRRDYVH